MFNPVSSRVSFPEVDAKVLRQWEENDVFHRSWSERKDAPLFVMFEGPPTANGSPGIHHVLARVFKDVICRYRTMKGYRCLRKGGWDTHGLPVELEVENELGLASKRDIEEYGIEQFNQKCRESVFRYLKDWELLTERIGFWVDMERPYITLDNDYIESGWAILKELWDRGLLYRDMRGTPHCPRCVTSLSSHEVALGYREDTPDPSVFVKFRVISSGRQAGEAGEIWSSSIPSYLLAWTTTPWTLPGNTALAVDATADYSLVEVEDSGEPERLVLASELVERVIDKPHRVLSTYKGSALVGLTYEKLYDPAAYGTEIRQFKRSTAGGTATMEAAAFFNSEVLDADFVSMEDGTGIVHIAPAFGDDDLGLGRENGLAFVQPVDLLGKVTGTYPFAGAFVKDADPQIMEDLERRGLLYRRDIYRHTYPFCWRCDTPLLYYAKSSWYIRTSAFKDRLVSGNDEINWYPDYIKDGRFGEWLRNNVDWAISRERYWGTPIPIWECQDCGHSLCIGSVAELKAQAVPQAQEDLEAIDLHRPYVDNVLLQCPADGCRGQMRRIPEVMDAWFDSGAMPFAQWHYPFENQGIDKEEDGRFPADYICEAVDQTRGWFYSLHALSILLKDRPSYRNVICLGLVLDERGRKMSKRVGNVVEPMPVLDEHGADALRWYLFTASQPGDSRRFSSRLVNETLRRVLLTLWNVYSFFTNYASIDRFHPEQKPAGWSPESELDRWILSELNSLVTQVDGHLDGYDPTNAGRRIQDLIDRLSNWYVRRSRRRFWRSENDGDKLSGYITLHTCLVTLAKLMAPLAPFVSEEIYQGLVRAVDPDAPDSVHLAQFPAADQTLIDEELMEATRLAMRVSSMGRGARSRAGLKVRQPLPRVVVKTRTSTESDILQNVQSQILDELNVKVLDEGGQADLHQAAVAALGDASEGVVQVDGFWVALDSGYMVAVDGAVTPELAEEGLARELVHRIQNLRRAADFQVTDRIITFYQAPEEIGRVMSGNFSDYIRQETLSDDLVDGAPQDGVKTETSKVDGMEVTLAVRRV